MLSQSKILATLALLTTLTYAQGASKGSGKTTRYWDCCKPSCAWEGKGQAAGLVQTCDINDKPLTDKNAASGCEGGPAFMCSSQSPWAISADLAYGFGAVSSSNVKCCACYALTFTSGPVSGKKMIIQATNTGGDVAAAQFDLAIPGGGFGLFDGCTKEWKATSDVWGQQYGGMSSNKCSQIAKPLQAGCGFRWDWMKGADNPTVDYEEVTCPAEIVAKSGCGVGGGSVKPPTIPTTPTTLTTKKAETKTTPPATVKPSATNGPTTGGGTTGNTGNTGNTGGGNPTDVGDDECEL